MRLRVCGWQVEILLYLLKYVSVRMVFCRDIGSMGASLIRPPHACWMSLQQGRDSDAGGLLAAAKTSSSADGQFKVQTETGFKEHVPRPLPPPASRVMFLFRQRMRQDMGARSRRHDGTSSPYRRSSEYAHWPHTYTFTEERRKGVLSVP